jgi:hypothetical protein
LVLNTEITLKLIKKSLNHQRGGIRYIKRGSHYIVQASVNTRQELCFFATQAQLSLMECFVIGFMGMFRAAVGIQ